MHKKRILEQWEIFQAGNEVVKTIQQRTHDLGPRIYGIPRGGVPVAYILKTIMPGVEIVDNPKHADFFVDDIIDSGATAKRYNSLYGADTVALFEKGRNCGDEWLVFPWEGTPESGVTDNVIRLLQFIGEDVERPGLLETPKRVAKAWQEMTSGYGVDIKGLMKVFADGANGYDEMVVVRDLPFYSNCEHHMVPFFGTATIGYIPDGRIVGLSKLGRVLEAFARRLQVQERLTVQVAEALMEFLQPKGVGVIIKARHLCMEARGLSKQGHETRTSVLRGVFMENSSARAEFLSMVK